MLGLVLGAVSRWAIPALICVFLLLGWLRRVPVYEAFIQGGAEGFMTAIQIIPYLVAMFVAIKVFRVSGAMELLAHVCAPVLRFLGVPTEVLPLAIMRPLSGSSALGLATELIKTYGPDSFVGRLASVMQGFHRHHLLRADGLFRFGRGQTLPARRHPGSAGRSSGLVRLHLDLQPPVQVGRSSTNRQRILPLL